MTAPQFENTPSVPFGFSQANPRGTGTTRPNRKRGLSEGRSLSPGWPGVSNRAEAGGSSAPRLRGGAYTSPETGEHPGSDLAGAARVGWSSHTSRSRQGGCRGRGWSQRVGAGEDDPGEEGPGRPQCCGPPQVTLGGCLCCRGGLSVLCRTLVSGDRTAGVGVGGPESIFPKGTVSLCTPSLLRTGLWGFRGAECGCPVCPARREGRWCSTASHSPG